MVGVSFLSHFLVIAFLNATNKTLNRYLSHVAKQSSSRSPRYIILKLKLVFLLKTVSSTPWTLLQIRATDGQFQKMCKWLANACPQDLQHVAWLESVPAPRPCLLGNLVMRSKDNSVILQGQGAIDLVISRKYKKQISAVYSLHSWVDDDSFLRQQQIFPIESSGKFIASPPTGFLDLSAILCDVNINIREMV